jgi:hypothetical protein
MKALNLQMTLPHRAGGPTIAASMMIIVLIGLHPGIAPRPARQKAKYAKLFIRGGEHRKNRSSKVEWVKSRTSVFRLRELSRFIQPPATR